MVLEERMIPNVKGFYAREHEIYVKKQKPYEDFSRERIDAVYIIHKRSKQ